MKFKPETNIFHFIIEFSTNIKEQNTKCYVSLDAETSL